VGNKKDQAFLKVGRERDSVRKKKTIPLIETVLLNEIAKNAQTFVF
jgi:hypothetical protein